MASFKILKPRSKKYDFLFLSYFFFFFTWNVYTHSTCYFELWERKFVGILQFFRKRGLDSVLATFSLCFFLREGGEAHHSCFHSAWHTVWLSQCGWKTAPVLICPTSHRYSCFFPSISSICPFFPFHPSAWNSSGQHRFCKRFLEST